MMPSAQMYKYCQQDPNIFNGVNRLTSELNAQIHITLYLKYNHIGPSIGPYFYVTYHHVLIKQETDIRQGISDDAAPLSQTLFIL